MNRYSRRVTLPLLAAALVAGRQAAAQEPYLVRDISNGPGSSTPRSFASVGNRVYFAALDWSGIELWKSDGTSEGTALVKDIALTRDTNPQELTPSNGLVFFRAKDDFTIDRLWRSDGTEHGTYKLGPFGENHYLERMADVNGTLFFAAFSPTGYELWKTDGTLPGTRLVRSALSGITEMASVDGTLFFIVSPATGGSFELWKSDGSESGTVALWQLSGPASSSVSSLTALGDVLFFRVAGIAGASGLWTSDGTAGGTVLVRGMNCFGLAAVGGALYFGGWTDASDGGLWKSDGSTEGTVFVKAVSPSGITNVGGMAFFTAFTQQFGSEVWRSDGTAEGTVMVKDIFPGSFGGGPSLRPILDVDGIAYFDANDGVHGRELWRSDGTETGTVMVRDFNPGFGDGFVGGLHGGVTGRLLFFTADDGQTGRELWALAHSPSLSIGNATVTEGDAGTVDARFTLTLSGVSTRTVTVDYATADDSATAGSDYVAASGTVTFAPGATTRTVAVSVYGDTLVEPEERFFVNLSNPSHAALDDGHGVGTIGNDDFAAGYGSTPSPPGPIAFGDTALGTSVQASFVVRETGGATLVVGDPALGGASPGDFAVLTAFPLSIPDGAPPRTVDLACAPSAAGARSATLTLTTNDPARPRVAYDLTCTGLAAGYGSNPSPPGPIDFGSTLVGVTANAGFEVQETGAATLVFGNPTLGGASPGDFAVLTGFPLSIPDGGAPRAVELTCTPSAPGPRSATLTLVTNDPARPTVLYELTCTATEGLMFYTVSPCRVLDTRLDGGPIAAGDARIVPFAGSCDISPTAKAVSINLTVTTPSTAGNIRLFPAGTPLPSVSALNYAAGQTRGNNAIVGLSELGALAAFCGQPSGTAHLILDVNGYFE